MKRVNGAEVYLDTKAVFLKAGGNLDSPDCPDIITANGSQVTIVTTYKTTANLI